MAKKIRNPHAFVMLYVGKMKPLNQGIYSRNFINRSDKPKEKIFVYPQDEYLFNNPFLY